MNTPHKMEHVVQSDTYDRWNNGQFSICRYSEWDGKYGTFFVAYDLHKLSQRINQIPVASYEEALALCK